MSGNGMIAVGDPAPGFSLAASDGRTYTLADELNRHHVALFFYPGNDTPG
jgi:peroxiredoxin